MPKIIDHDRRRLDIVDAYLRVLGREGMAGTNGRTVAAELGVAPGTLWHYFDSIEQISEAAALRGVERTLARIDERRDGERGLAALIGVAEEILPLSPVTTEEARVVVAFWGRVPAASSDAPTRRRSGALGRVRQFSDLTARALQQAVDDGELRPETPLPQLARLLDSVYAGEQVISVAALEPSRPDEAREVVAFTLAPWLDAGSMSPAAALVRRAMRRP